MRRDLLAAGVLASLVGCSPKPAPLIAPAAPAAAPSVVKVEKRAIKRMVEQPGTVQAFDEVTLYAKVAGYVGELAPDADKAARPEHDRRIDIGSKVKKGQLLAELLVPELDEEAKLKAAVGRQTDAEVEQAKKAVTAAAAGVDAARAHLTETKAGLTRAQALNDR